MATAFASTMAMWAAVDQTESAIANGETRSLSMKHLHTGETINITYKRDGRYDSDALKKLNWFLRDWRRDEPTRMDPRLFDTIWLAYHAVGATQPVNVVCGYRSPETNGMLRRRSRGVAKFSQHTLGKAMDFFIPGVPLSKLRVAGLRLQRGGVGFYPTSGSPFVHMDAGGVRMWPRMSRSELASVFPDGKTVLIPADGRPMAGYQVAMNEILRKGGTVGGRQGAGDDDGGGGDDNGGGGFFASLFGHRSSQTPSETMMQASASSRGGLVAPSSSAPAPTVVAMARPAQLESPARMASIPLPERRPSGIDASVEVADAGDSVPDMTSASASNVPLPPVRPDGGPVPSAPPQQVASLDGPAIAQDVSAAAPAAAMPARPASITPSAEKVPVARPASASATLQPRPAIFADLSKGGEGFMKRSAGRQPQRALGFADVSPVTRTARPPRPTLTATRFEKLNFVSLSAPVPSARNKEQAQLIKPDLTTTASLIAAPSRTVLIKFGVAAYQDLRAEKFSGAAVKPLRTASFSPMPDIFTGSIVSSN
ncbi:DUF882 domain-containing protein [Labrys monachus]|uniref:Murein endopeptidase K n=1 Tax=Labrys monachus TaxID=217067 RepID=A0ABU0FPF0_9HYPH|nr:DUF882 domain-containing protein [Labrys monachus]MDQ0396484.1 uncharacterized protein YcbK (DUF882 family) [Labrys monachus]